MTITIIDISFHQDPVLIDYDALSANIDGVILRCAYGAWKDARFDTHYAEFKKRGIPMGAYLFLIGYKPIADQVIAMRNAIAGKDLKLGLWNDVEREDGAMPITAKHVNEFMTLAEAEFGKLGIYSGYYSWKEIMGVESGKYADRKLWQPAYTSADWFDEHHPGGWTNWWLWQYTSSGRLPGYVGNLDMNKFNGDRAAFDKWTGVTTVEPPVVIPTTKTIQLMTVQVAKLRIRKTPEISLFNFIDWLYQGNVVEILEKRQIGADIWARVGQKQWAAVKYKGEVMMV